MCTAIPYMETVFSLVGLHIWDSGTLYHKITKKHVLVEFFLIPPKPLKK